MTNLRFTVMVARSIILLATVFSFFIVMPWIFSWNSAEVFYAFPLAIFGYIMLVFFQIKGIFNE